MSCMLKILIIGIVSQLEYAILETRHLRNVLTKYGMDSYKVAYGVLRLLCSELVYKGSLYL